MPAVGDPSYDICLAKREDSRVRVLADRGVVPYSYPPELTCLGVMLPAVLYFVSVAIIIAPRLRYRLPANLAPLHPCAVFVLGR